VEVVLKLGAFWKVLTGPSGKGPSYPELPDVDARGETSVSGIYVAGELAGTPLVKLGLNAGHDVVLGLARELPEPRDADEALDLVIVGSGSSGLAATVAARDLGLRAVTLEAASFANTFVTMTKGKILFAEPEDVVCRSRVGFEECTREELLDRWRELVREEDLAIHEHEKVTRITGTKGDFTVHTPVTTYRCRRVILCLGKAGNPRRLGVPGERENAGCIHHRLLDSSDHVDQDILIVGAGDVACEAAIALAGGNRVTMAAIDTALIYPKKRNADAVRQLVADGELSLHLSTSIASLEDGFATLESPGGTHQVRYDTAFVMIGAELPVRFLEETGIRLNTQWQLGKWVALAASFVAVYCLYALKSYGKGLVAWPFEGLISAEVYDRTLQEIFHRAFAPFAWLFEHSALVEIYADRGFQQGYLYSGLYTLAMLWFGFEALIRWRKYATNPRYQTWRFASLLSFQVGFFLLVNVVGVQYLSVKYSWRAWGLYQPFPLFFNTYFWWYPGDPKWLVAVFVGAGLFGTFVAIPWASRNHGKRFCTWICGCGGLAETLGDRWRHLAPKGARSRAWEFQGAVVLAAAVIVALVLVGFYETTGSNPWWRTYNYIVDFWLVAVIPIALYPFFGGKIWCRYWCPLAAYNGWLARWYGRLQIVSNDKCITCTECSKYCQVGIDVMAFARNQEPMDNRNSSCIQCGICIDVCPVDVLSFALKPSTPRAESIV